MAPSTTAASSSVAGAACRRAVRNRNANGNERHASNAMTVNSAAGRWLRNAIGSSHPSSCVPQWLTTPNWGLSIVDQAKVTATIGAT